MFLLKIFDQLFTGCFLIRLMINVELSRKNIYNKANIKSICKIRFFIPFNFHNIENINKKVLTQLFFLYISLRNIRIYYIKARITVCVWMIFFKYLSRMFTLILNNWFYRCMKQHSFELYCAFILHTFLY